MKLSTMTAINPETLEADRLNRLTKVIQETLGNAYTLVKILDICIKKPTTKVRCICNDIEWDDQKVRSITFKNSELKAKIELLKAEEEKALQEEKVAEEVVEIDTLIVKKYVELKRGEPLFVTKINQTKNTQTFKIVGAKLGTIQKTFTNQEINQNFKPDWNFQDQYVPHPQQLMENLVLMGYGPGDIATFRNPAAIGIKGIKIN